MKNSLRFAGHLSVRHYDCWQLLIDLKPTDYRPFVHRFLSGIWSSQGCIKLTIWPKPGRGVSPKRPCLGGGGRLGEASLPELDAPLWSSRGLPVVEVYPGTDSRSAAQIRLDWGDQARTMDLMDADEKEICNYLKAYGGQYVSGREIARRAAGKWRFREDANWAAPVLVRLVEKNILESDASGYYRLRSTQKKKPKKWISPQMKAILERSGKDFGELLTPEEEEDFFK